MDIDKKTEYCNQVITFLRNEHIGTVPQAILGFNKYPDLNTEDDRNFREVEAFLLKQNLVKQRGKALNDYAELNLIGDGYTVNSNDELEMFALVSLQAIREDSAPAITTPPTQVKDPHPSDFKEEIFAQLRNPSSTTPDWYINPSNLTRNKTTQIEVKSKNKLSVWLKSGYNAYIFIIGSIVTLFAILNGIFDLLDSASFNAFLNRLFG